MLLPLIAEANTQRIDFPAKRRRKRAKNVKKKRCVQKRTTLEMPTFIEGFLSQSENHVQFWTVELTKPGIQFNHYIQPVKLAPHPRLLSHFHQILSPAKSYVL